MNWNAQNKFGAKKTPIIFQGQEVTFDSKAESIRAKQLELLERGGYITDLRLQPAFVLIESYRRNGKNVSAGVYVADFEYIEKTGQRVIEDTKGLKTAAYNFKKKLFLFSLSDDIIFRESTYKNGRFEIKDY